MSRSPPIPQPLWDTVPPAAQSAVLALVNRLHQEIAHLQQQVVLLQERLNQNSTNSSRPPSTDPPTVKRRPPRPASGRSAGGQPGHERQQRPLLPPTHTEILRPVKCRHCGQTLSGDDSQPL